MCVYCLYIFYMFILFLGSYPLNYYATWPCSLPRIIVKCTVTPIVAGII